MVGNAGYSQTSNERQVSLKADVAAESDGHPQGTILEADWPRRSTDPPVDGSAGIVHGLRTPSRLQVYEVLPSQRLTPFTRRAEKCVTTRESRRGFGQARRGAGCESKVVTFRSSPSISYRGGGLWASFCCSPTMPPSDVCCKARNAPRTPRTAPRHLRCIFGYPRG